MEIKNIYCVGRNYRLHAQELNNAIPTSPFLFSKPTHAFVEAKGQTIQLPGDQGAVHYETELVFHMARNYEPNLPIEALIDQMTIGLDLTLRDVQDELKKKAYPWLLAKGFPNSAVLASWLPFEGLQDMTHHDFTLEKNGQEVQRGNIKDMIFDLPTLLEFSAKHFGLEAGDIIFTGTPAGVGALADEDALVLKWKERMIGDCKISIAAK
ncbi:fumarylacetoacetate hydrolase family protein [Desulfitobacterium metallireducens]|uniref:Fumarylacetoacetate hydrolase n=1 Tax=Desulfitobacterium metallireducens DSM 15288 TaxID=871968 RepID=W0EAN4_9FIRM|nr:fumarylacetoacetate hydrolase family protein [Desulfitobacterium metallireducens]AHF06121.1 fumarylacetoacetate hydrolase [Desulfitobacterium metallireducens DSM 15288]